MTYDFFADAEDKIALLDYIFKETDLQVFDLASALGADIKEYNTVADITSCFDLKNNTPNGVHFQLWSPQFGGQIEFQRVNLNPDSRNGHTFRYNTRGWGLIQLYLQGINGNRLMASHIGHFNRAGALKWEAIHQDIGSVDSWDWKAIQKTSSHLKYLLHKRLSVKTIGSRGVLAGAEKLEKNGIKLW
jgi:hypothetical protein